MKKTNLSWVGALLVFALLLWCTAATPGKIDDPSTYTCAVYSSALSLLPPVIAIVLALNTKEVYTSLLVGIATGALLYANGNLELALTTLFFNEEPLSQIVRDLERAFNVKIEIKDRQLSTERFYGDFRNDETITEILDIMAANNNLYYTIDGDEIIISRK